jgi:phosphatidylglycerophosphatase C
LAYSSPTENQNRVSTVAVFDFDGTLIKGDSLGPFLIAAAGTPRAFFALMEAAALAALRYSKNKHDPELRDLRTFIKAHLLRRLLKGKSTGQLAPAIEKLKLWLQWNEAVRQKLLDHHAKGHHIVIASGGLDLYLPELVKEVPHNALLCTRVELKDGPITGEMPAGNCVRQRKAEVVKDYLAVHGPFAESWGYGNFPHDVPMLNLLKHRIIV